MSTFAATYAALFPIGNPLGNAALFLGITEGQEQEQTHPAEENAESVHLIQAATGT